jgi:hypothetical protein
MGQMYRQGSKRALALLGVAGLLMATWGVGWALGQNLGTAPQTGIAVQGETAAQPEGFFLNLVNWIANVIAPVGAGRLLGPSSPGSRAGDSDDGFLPPPDYSACLASSACSNSGSHREQEVSLSETIRNRNFRLRCCANWLTSRAAHEVRPLKHRAASQPIPFNR